MADDRLKPEVELPARRVRPVCMGAAMSILFALGARNYVASTMTDVHAPSVMRLELVSDPPGATVTRISDGKTMCVTPCAVGIQEEPGRAELRFKRAGYFDRTVTVNLLGGDTRAEVVLERQPAKPRAEHRISGCTLGADLE
jgi:hypothetical protein